MTVLGDTIAKIAFEKAGIIKRGAPVVVAPQVSDYSARVSESDGHEDQSDDEAMAVFRDVAKERDAPLVDVKSTMTWQKSHGDLQGQSFEVKSPRDYYTLWTPLIGDYQLENASTAIAAAETLIDQGFAISKASIVKGLRDVRWPARLQILSRDGRQIVVDGAHNPYSVKRLTQTIRDLFDFERVILIFGALGGHSARGMIAELASLGESVSVIAVRSRHPRAAPSDIIANVVTEKGLPVVFTTESVRDGVRHALEIAGENDLVLGTGSLAVAAEIIEEINGIAPEVYPNITPPPNPGRNI
jgi:dihydrofolate synthase/folylpolyglutamate synthase